jgi:hypothetical protein
MTDPIMPSRLMPSPDALETRVGDETVLLHLVNAAYYGLDPVGTLIWEGIKSGHDRARIRDDLLAAYDVTPDILTADMDRFLADLLAHDILVPTNA